MKVVTSRELAVLQASSSPCLTGGPPLVVEATEAGAALNEGAFGTEGAALSSWPSNLGAGLDEQATVPGFGLGTGAGIPFDDAAFCCFASGPHSSIVGKNSTTLRFPAGFPTRFLAADSFIPSVIAFLGGARSACVRACACNDGGSALTFDARSNTISLNWFLRYTSSDVSEGCGPELEEDRLHGTILPATGRFSS